jgi:hypothetical protein
MGLLTASCYLVACSCLLPGTALLLPAYAAHYAQAINWLVVATSLLSFAGTIDFCSALRPFLVRPVRVSPSPLLAQTKRGSCARYLPLLNPAFMLLGALLLLAGALMFLPAVAELEVLGTTVDDLGLWAFRSGNFAYLGGSFTALQAIRSSPKGLSGARLDVFGLLNYIIGALLYILGGAISQLNAPGFAEVWIVASVNFVLGALSFMPWPNQGSKVEKGATDGQEKA